MSAAKQTLRLTVASYRNAATMDCAVASRSAKPMNTPTNRFPAAAARGPSPAKRASRQAQQTGPVQDGDRSWRASLSAEALVKYRYKLVILAGPGGRLLGYTA